VSRLFREAADFRMLAATIFEAILWLILKISSTDLRDTRLLATGTWRMSDQQTYCFHRSETLRGYPFAKTSLSRRLPVVL
jgi:hypothetical protein